MKQLTLKLYTLVNKIIFRGNNASSILIDQCKNEYSEFKAKFLFRGVETFGDFFLKFEVCTFVFIYRKKEKLKSNYRNSRFFSLKIANKNKLTY